MTGTIPLGHVAGIRLGLHWSVAGIVGLIVFLLGSYWLPSTFPGHAEVLYWLAGVAAAALLVVSILVHELAHAVVAVRNGVPVDGITLWLLGGMARLRGEAATPRSDLLIAVVGPVTSGALAVVFAGVTWMLALVQAGELTVAVAGYLSALNLVVAVFNLLPAAPLDGGRVLRAALWSRTGDRFRAAVWAARAGAGLGFLLVAYGFVSVLTRGFEGVWAVLVGFFVIQAAGAEKQQARVSAALAGIRVRDLPGSRIIRADADSTVWSAFEFGDPSGNTALAVTGTPEGIVTPEQLRAVPLARRTHTRLRELAQPLSKFDSATSDEPLTALLARRGSSTSRSVLVLENEHPVGMVPADRIERILRERLARATRQNSAVGNTVPPDTEPPADWWYPGQGERNR
ncbi:site-2 protease family protein [Actinopolyspora mortivallis]|uniref:site-2 protease family protein n=1 Tax=Actinopolyspora mortivallis TaxID=33906 RepID=UPI000378302A|nr:site-2 protease family protein [Actinopolyspora mortivallis]